jgi:hypothetical protein
MGYRRHAQRGRCRDESVSPQSGIISQDFAQRYEQVVWMDADIMINNRTAPRDSSGESRER